MNYWLVRCCLLTWRTSSMGNMAIVCHLIMSIMENLMGTESPVPSWWMTVLSSRQFSVAFLMMLRSIDELIRSILRQDVICNIWHHVAFIQIKRKSLQQIWAHHQEPPKAMLDVPKGIAIRNHRYQFLEANGSIWSRGISSFNCATYDHLRKSSRGIGLRKISIEKIFILFLSDIKPYLLCCLVNGLLVNLITMSKKIKSISGP